MFLHDNISIDFYYYNVTRSFLKFPIKCGKKRKKEKKYLRIFKKNMKLIFDKAYQFLNVIITNYVMITNRRKKKENDRRLDNIYSYIVCL